MRHFNWKWWSAALVLMVAVLVGLYIGDRIGRAIFPTLEEEIRNDLLRPHSLPTVDLSAWRKLKIGMTKKEVESLIGEAESISNYITEDGSETETWQYGWSEGMLPELLDKPSDRAYLVTFADGKLISLREPIKSTPK